MIKLSYIEHCFYRFSMYLDLKIEELLALYTNSKNCIPAILVQSQNSEIFQVSERNITNQKILDNWGNGKMGLPRAY